jgi:hypothetical protein
LANIAQVREMMSQAATATIDGVEYRILTTEDDHCLAEHEDTGDEVQIRFDEVDLSRDLIYKLVLMNP